MGNKDTVQPVIALAMGDPAGISAELAAKALGLPEVRAAADFIVIGDRRLLDEGATIAGVKLDLPDASAAEIASGARNVLLDRRTLDPVTIQRGVAARAGGVFALENFRTALRLAADGAAQAVCFTPFNKKAMRLARPSYDDEIGFMLEVLGIEAPASEFNILDGLWNARVTSHVPLSAVAPLITRASVLRAIRLTQASLRAAGITNPRLLVAGLNPHAGDGGNFGGEEINEIAPAIEDAQAEGINVDGPFPADTVFVRARNGGADAVVTMYHDQGQIAMKLMGFDRGVTLMGGFPFPICTPAHGTAYDIAGKGIANIGATRAAILLAARMASERLVPT
jgi:4-hydroxythreonine-4-phosphate dehydrogenase